jgi:hypothetical protein
MTMNQPEQVSDGLLTLLVGVLGGSFGTIVLGAIAKCLGWL